MWSRLILAGVLGVAAAAAQGGMGGGMGGDMGGGGMGRGRGGGGDSMDRGPMMGRPSNRLDVMSEMLKLDKDQKKQVKSIMDDGQKEAAPLKEEMLKTRTAIADAVAAGRKGDDLKPSLDAYAAAEVKMHQIELGAFARIYQLLEKDQQSKAGPIFGMMSGVFKGKNWTDMN